MTDAELEALLNDIESDRVERTESLSDPGKVKKVICAFANDMPNHKNPGVVFVGVKDDGACAGLSITDELLSTLALDVAEVDRTVGSYGHAMHPVEVAWFLFTVFTFRNDCE